MGHGRRMTVIRKREKNKNKTERKERKKPFIEKQEAWWWSTAVETFWAGMGTVMVCVLPSPASFSLSPFSGDSLEIIWSKRLRKRPHLSFDVRFHVWQTTVKGRYWKKAWDHSLTSAKAIIWSPHFQGLPIRRRQCWLLQPSKAPGCRPQAGGLTGLLGQTCLPSHLCLYVGALSLSANLWDSA